MFNFLVIFRGICYDKNMKMQKYGQKLYLTVANDIINKISNDIIDVGDKLPTTKELAKIYNVSIVTVEHALKLLKEMNIVYSIKKAGTFVNGKNTGNQQIIAFILPDNGKNSKLILKKATVTALLNNCFLDVMISYESPEKERELLRRILQGNYDAAIIYPNQSSANIDIYSEFLIRKFPFIFIDRSIQAINTTLVTSDNAGGISMLIQYLVENGHKDIAFYAVHPQMPTTEHLRFISYCETLISLGICLKSQYIYSLKYPRHNNIDKVSTKNINRFIEDYKKLDPPPTAVICVNDHIAVQLKRAFEHFGYKVPEDISITGYDYSFTDTQNDITTIKQNFEEIGRMAILEILKKIKGESSAAIVTTSVSLHIGNSVKKIH